MTAKDDRKNAEGYNDPTRHFSVTMLIPMITAISFISSMVA